MFRLKTKEIPQTMNVRLIQNTPEFIKIIKLQIKYESVNKTYNYQQMLISRERMICDGKAYSTVCSMQKASDVTHWYPSP